ncbi:MAG: RluA family pseudouridine synthase [Planctomycetes bacterium]|nr:RluA family pseudouridine synthase [Planctomycetota bacterium]
MNRPQGGADTRRSAPREYAGRGLGSNQGGLHSVHVRAAQSMTLNRGHVYRDRVLPEHAGMRMLDYHVEHFRHSDATAWRAVIESGAVRVNGRVASADERVRGGDELEYHRGPWDEPEAPREFRVVLEDEHVLVVEKPAGLQVLPAGGFSEQTLLRIVQASAIERATAAPVHRLGRGTSGLILFGKTELARAELARQFRACEPRKTYFALVRGAELPVSCIARTPIGKLRHGPLVIHAASAEGKPSVTRIRVLRRRPECSLVAAQPITGRPDQIRIHLAACGAPIVGDPLFGPGGAPISDAVPGAGGYFLHAAGLAFAHPAGGAQVKLRSRPDWWAELA